MDDSAHISSFVSNVIPASRKPFRTPMCNPAAGPPPARQIALFGRRFAPLSRVRSTWCSVAIWHPHAWMVFREARPSTGQSSRHLKGAQVSDRKAELEQLTTGARRSPKHFCILMRRTSVPDPAGGPRGCGIGEAKVKLQKKHKFGTSLWQLQKVAGQG